MHRGCARRESLSTRVLVDLYAHVASDLSDYFERASLDEPARFPVSWAGDQESPAWFDIGRELTEIWHHGAQIRDAVDAGPFPDPRWLRAVLDMAVRGLPHAYRTVDAAAGASMQLEITGPSGGSWVLEATHRRLGYRCGCGRRARRDRNDDRRDGVAAAVQRAAARGGRVDGSPQRRYRPRPSVARRSLGYRLNDSVLGPRSSLERQLR